MLIIWLPEKMFRDLRKSKVTQSDLLHQWRFGSVGCIRNVSETWFCILHIRAFAQGTRYSNVNASFFTHSTHLAEATVTLRLVIPLPNQPSGGQYCHKSCSLSPLALLHHTKTNNAMFHAQCPFKLVHAASLSSTKRTTALWGNLSPL